MTTGPALSAAITGPMPKDEQHLHQMNSHTAVGDLSSHKLAAPSCARAPWSFYTDRQRWTFLSVLFLVAMANYFDYFILSILLEPIKHEFHVSDTMLGVLSGLCFAVVYSAAAVPAALWADRGNRRTVITLALTGWSFATALCGFAQSFAQLALARFGVGAFEPGAMPSAQSLIADYFPPERRATALAIFTNGGSAAGWLGGIGLGGYLAATQGWRMAFVLAGLASLVVALGTRLTLREPRSLSKSLIGEAHTEGVVKTIAGLYSKRSFVLTLTGASIYGVFVYGVMMFIPSLLIRSLHASLAQISLTWGSIIALANLVGAVIGGALADRLSRRDIRWYAWLPAIACMLALPLYGLALSASRLWILIGIEFLAELVLSVGIPIVFAVVVSVSGARRRALASAAVFSVMVLFGGNLGPLFVGWMSDRLSPAYGTESLRYALLAVLTFLLPAAAAFYWASRSMPHDCED